MLSNRSAFANLFQPGSAPIAQCATPLCDRRPARGSRWCPCCIQDRIEGRIVVKRAADEILPFTVQMERKSSAGPCPFMGKGDAGTREIKRHRRAGKYAKGKKNTPWSSNPPGDPRKRTGISFSPAGLRTTRVQ